MEKQVTFHFNPVSVVATGGTEKELLENAKKAVILQMQEKFPKFEYLFSDPMALTLETCCPGMIIEHVKDGKLGIVMSKSKTKINVMLKGDIGVIGAPHLFKKSSASFEEARSRRAEYMRDEWNEGNSCYAKVGGVIEALIVGKKVGNKRQLWLVNSKGRFISLTESQLTLLKEEKADIK